MSKGNAVGWAALIVAVAALLSSQGLMRQAPAVQDIPAEGQRIAGQLSEAFEAVADYSKPSVVQITSVQKAVSPGQFSMPRGGQNPQAMPEELRDQLKKFFDEFNIEPQQMQTPQRMGTGSGFVYDDKGHILTNNHVVADAEKVTVQFHDGKTVTAKVVATDPKTDVAVIKVDTTEYRPLPLGDSSKLKVGEWVVAVGSPFGLTHSVTAGIISAKSRGSLGILGRDGFGDFIQTDCAINPGNSGGPLIDMNGRVVAINTAIATGSRSNSGVGFAIPISLADQIAKRLIKDGKIKRAQIGIMFGPLNDEIIDQLKLPKESKGIVVGSVLNGSPAQKAGLKPNDVVTKFQGEAIEDTEAFRRKVADSEIGAKVALDVIRDSKPIKLELTLGDADAVSRQPELAFENDGPQANPDDNNAAEESETLGMELAEIQKREDKLGFDPSVKGLLILGVTRGSIAAAAKVKSGQLIDQVIPEGGKPQPVATVEEFKKFAKSGKIAFRVSEPNGSSRVVEIEQK